jgi:hypothetical protein
MCSPGRLALRTLGRAAIAACLLVLGPASVTAPVARAAPLPGLVVSISSESIAVIGAMDSGAVNVLTTAAPGLKEPDSALVLLKPGVTVAEAETYLASNKAGDPNTVSRIGSIVFDSQARPGETTEAQTTLAPGTYVAVNAEGQRSSRWSRTSFTVTASPVPLPLPGAEVIERTIDYSFTGPTTLHRGELVRFENEGWVVHMDEAFPARTKKSAERLARNLLAGHETAAAKLVSRPPVSFAGPLSTGGLQQERITAAPGWYVQVCFLDTQDHRPHTLFGMERVIRITD